MSSHIQVPVNLPRGVGFRDGERGTHTSRTIMCAELRILMTSLPGNATKADYRNAIIDDNILGKRTTSTRRLSSQRLNELYALDPDVLLFRVFRQFWDNDDIGRPLLASLCANARDPILRLTSVAILPVTEGEHVATESIADALALAVPNRFNPDIRHKIARNAASSWTQSGHLAGRTNKIRARAKATPASTAYALLLGYLSGLRGEFLFDTYWIRLLDTPASQVDELAFQAARQGWISYKRLGAVVEVSFPGLLTPQDQEAIRGQN